MNNIEFEIKMSQQYISVLRKAVRIAGCILIINIGLIILNIYPAFYNHSIINAVGFGCFMVNFIWSALYLGEFIEDHYLEKERLRLLKVQRDNSQEYYM